MYTFLESGGFYEGNVEDLRRECRCFLGGECGRFLRENCIEYAKCRGF